MKHLQLVCTNPSMLEHALTLLEKGDLQHMYTLEDPDLGGILIGGFCENPLELPPYLTLHSEEEAVVDWDAQWKEFSPYATVEGDISCSLKAFGGPEITLRLFPGAGFGDISHPTTQLMLTLMCTQPLSFVVDIGCGGGVLSCAAGLLGAEKVYGYDIDPQAVHHAEKNTLLNDVQRSVKVGEHPLPEVSKATILLNMTLAEQKTALAAVNAHDCTWIVSGIHTENLDAFSTFIEEKGLEISHHESLNDWHAFILS